LKEGKKKNIARGSVCPVRQAKKALGPNNHLTNGLGTELEKQKKLGKENNKVRGAKKGETVSKRKTQVVKKKKRGKEETQRAMQLRTRKKRESCKGVQVDTQFLGV